MDATTLEAVGAAVVASGVAGGAIWALRARRAHPIPAESGRAVAPLAEAPRGLAAALVASSRRFRDRLDAALRAADGDVLDRVEEALLGADVGAATTRYLLDAVRARYG